MIWFGGERPRYESFAAANADSMITWLGMEFVEAGDDFLRMLRSEPMRAYSRKFNDLCKTFEPVMYEVVSVSD